jgi:hypothetical protein
MLPLFQPVAGLLAQHTLYAIGGAVRAHVRGEEAAEVDFCTPSLPEHILATAIALNLPTTTEGLKWGSVRVAGYDITTFRTEAYAANTRYPVVNFTPDLLADAARRDFTCNAVYLAPNGELTDPYGGAAHWQAGQVVWLGSPAEKLTQDPLRWWRWLRFCAVAQSCASLYNPSSVETPGVPARAVNFLQLAAWAAAGQGYLSANLKAREAAKFAAQQAAPEIRQTVLELLAPHVDLAHILVP